MLTRHEKSKLIESGYEGGFRVGDLWIAARHAGLRTIEWSLDDKPEIFSESGFDSGLAGFIVAKKEGHLSDKLVIARILGLED